MLCQPIFFFNMYLAHSIIVVRTFCMPHGSSIPFLHMDSSMLDIVLLWMRSESMLLGPLQHLPAFQNTTTTFPTHPCHAYRGTASTIPLPLSGVLTLLLLPAHCHLTIAYFCSHAFSQQQQQHTFLLDSFIIYRTNTVPYCRLLMLPPLPLLCAYSECHYSPYHSSSYYAFF